MEHLRALLNQDAACPHELRSRIMGLGGRAVSSAWANNALAIMMLVIREPRALLAPCAKPSAVGDIIEATRAMCEPWNTGRIPAREEFGKARGIGPKDFISRRSTPAWRPR